MLLLTIAVLGLAALMLPFAAHPFAPLPHISGMYGTATAIIDLATFWLLASAPRQPRSHAIIAAAYLFGALMAMAHVLTYPGAVLDDRAVVGSPHAVSLLFIAWRAGFAGFVLWAVLASSRDQMAARSKTSSLPSVLAVLSAVAFFFASQLTDAAALATVSGREMFSALSRQGSYAAAVLAVAAVLMIWRLRLWSRSIFVWLVFVLVAEATAVWLSTFSGGRYTLAWYATRVEGVIANAVVLVLLARHFRNLQMDLASTVAMLQLRTEGLQAEIHRRESAEVKLAQAKKLEAVGQLGAGLAHDLNNILQVVIARLALLQRRAGSAVDADVEVIRRNVRKAEALTRQLTLLSGRRHHNARPLDLTEIFLSIAEGLRALLAKRHELLIDVEPGLPHIAVDALELEIALTNLVTNARDAMPEGGQVAIGVRQVPRPDGTVSIDIQVRDTGYGMTAELRERAFEPFFTTKEPGKGTGLGLPQVHGFVSASGGSVSVESEPDRGTAVTMSFPIHAEPTNHDLSPRAAHPLRTGQVVLLVDDNDDVREASAQLLRASGCIVRQTSDASVALALLHDGFRPGLLISDIVMPGGLDGVELAHRARAVQPDLVILLVTGYSDAADTAKARGFPVMRKPYDLASLARALS
ncbi:ATP-binding protein [Azohydromonas lata]|uniref:histidine kinase n=1 Tax=Azohydromonas lata TaxID=45677 RepID=A0ABU5IKT0_9BURK|nr:ATP-binding protein [Azohydromonas lata]MDZ5459500.1 ATP-binding protein [Azohydromonas lata]